MHVFETHSSNDPIPYDVQIQLIKLDAEIQFFRNFLFRKSPDEWAHSLLWRVLDWFSIEDFSRIGMTLRLTNAHILKLLNNTDMDEESADLLWTYWVTHMKWLESVLSESEALVRIFLFWYLAWGILESPFSKEWEDSWWENRHCIH